MRYILLDSAAVMRNTAIMAILDNKIQSKIELSRARMERISHELNKLKAEYELERAKLETWQEASQLAQESRKTRSSSSRTANADWVAIFDIISRNHDGCFTYDIIETIAENHSVPIKRASLRAKMMQYVEKGHVQRIEDGVFKIAPEGYSFFKIMPSSPEKPASQKSAWDKPPTTLTLKDIGFD